MNKYINSLKFEEILLGTILFSLPISLGVNSFVVIISAGFFLYKTITRGNFSGLFFYIASFSFFLAQFISYLSSNNKHEAGTKLLLYASFVLFPICFSYLTTRKIKLNQNAVFKSLFYGVIIILIYGSIRFSYDILFHNVRYDYGRAVALLVKYIPHHTYFSMFILISIFSVFSGRIENSKNRKSVFILPILYLFLILLGSRMAIILGIIILPLFLFNKMKKQNNKMKALILLGLFMSIIIFIGFSNNYVRDKIIYTYYDLLNISTTEKPFFGVSFRLQIWYSILDLIYQSPFTGYGIGDITELLNIRYNKNELQGLNAHNQYLQFILHHGIIIFLFLFLFVYKLIKQCVLNKNSVLLFSWIVLLSFSFTESILNRQWGVILFAFIVNYSIYSNNLSSENNSK